MATHMTYEQATRELLNMIAARFPIIAVNTYEPETVVSQIGDIAKEQGRKLLEWRSTTGIRFLNFKPEEQTLKEWNYPLEPKDKKAPPNPGDIVSAIKHDIILIAHNLDDYLTPQLPMIRQQMADIAGDIQDNWAKTLIILGTNVTIPDDLQKMIAVLDWPLPDEVELITQVQQKIAQLEENNGITAQLDSAEIRRIVNALKGMTLDEADFFLNKAVIDLGRLDASEEMLKALGEHKKAVIRKHEMLEYIDAKLVPIGGLDVLKESLAEIAEVVHSDDAREFGANAPAGILLAGPPGTGKGLVALTVAEILGIPLIRLDMSAVFGPLVGQSEQQMRQALHTIEAITPCVLWIDEVEKGLGGDGTGERDGGTQQRVMGYLLTWLQDMKNNPDAPLVFGVATANRAVNLSGALLRRFEDVWFVDLPAYEERKEIFVIHLANKGRDADSLGIDLDVAAASTEGYSGAEIQRVVDTGLRRALLLRHQGQVEDLTHDIIMESITKVVPVSRTKHQEIEDMRAWARQARHASSMQRDAAPAVEQPASGASGSTMTTRRRTTRKIG